MTAFRAAMACLLCTILLLPLALQGQTPRTTQYQGYLVTATGQPVNTAVDLVFRIFPLVSGGAAVWTEAHTGVAVANGHFNVILGSTVPLDPLHFTAQRWLEVQVGSDSPMTPRQQLTSIPTALRAEALAATAQIDGAQVTGTLRNVTLVSPKIAAEATPTVCNDSRTGMLRWSTATRSMEACNGAQWTPLATEPLFKISRLFTGGVGNSNSTAITIGLDGLPIVAYDSGSVQQLRVAKCMDSACAGTAMVSTLDSGVQPRFISLKRSPDFYPAAAYLASATGGVKFARCSTYDCTDIVTVSTIEAASSQAGPGLSMTIPENDNRPVLSYYGGTGGGLRVVRCGSAFCNSTNFSTIVDPGSLVGIQTSVTVPPDFLPVIAYQDYNTSSLKVAKCLLSNCSTGATKTVLDAANTQAMTAITISTAGLPVIAYGGLGGGLKLALCANASCSAGTTLVTLDPSANPAQMSIAVGANGGPMVAYYDQLTMDLMLARCSDAACSAVAPVLTVDWAVGTMAVGRFPSVVVAADGLPVISYQESHSGTVKVAKCTAALCR